MQIYLRNKPASRFVETSRLVEWISEETDRNGEPLKRRVPQKHIREFKKIFGFMAGGMYYLSLRQLTFCCIDKKYDIYRDTYGNKVLVVEKRFPCFDYADYQNERRHYHWYYLVVKCGLVCVYYEDGETTIEVKEDVDVLPKEAWEKMQKAGWLEERW